MRTGANTSSLAFRANHWRAATSRGSMTNVIFAGVPVESLLSRVSTPSSPNQDMKSSSLTSSMSAAVRPDKSNKLETNLRISFEFNSFMV